MRYPTMTAGDANTYLVAKRGGTTIDADSLVRVRGSGSEVDQSFVVKLREAIGALRVGWQKE